MASTSAEQSRFMPSPRATIAVAVGIVVTLAAAVLLAALRSDTTFGTLSRDTFSLVDIPVYYGALSNIGVFAWVATASVCGAAAWLLHRHGGATDAVRFMVGAAAVTTILAIDDFFMVHEHSHLWRMSERPLLLAYGLMTLAFLWINRGLITGDERIRGNRGWLAISLAFFGASLAVDVAQEPLESAIGEWRVGLEDGFKFVGVIWWSGYFIKCALDLLGSRLESSPQRTIPERRSG